jgi:hypothetical protein
MESFKGSSMNWLLNARLLKAYLCHREKISFARWIGQSRPGVRSIFRQQICVTVVLLAQA